jgi:transcription antitermination factor NusG
MIPLSQNPPTRFPQKTIHEATERWWLAKVKPRQEKALAFDLLERQIEYYLPMYTKVSRRPDNNKPRKTITVLFPGYLPYCAKSGYERLIYSTNRIVNIVEIQHQKRFMDELEQIYHTLELGLPIEPVDSDIAILPGTPVQIEYGTLRGIVGTVVKVQNGRKLILSVEGLGRAAVTVTADMVKLLDESALK